jgi:hypothetical protein
VIRES